MTHRTQQQRATADNPPPPTGLIAGQLFLELGNPTRLWTGTATTPKLILDAAANTAAITAAQTAANTAQSAATAAQSTADSATTAAANAQTAANTAQSAANGAQTTATAAVKRAGDTMTGLLTLSADPAAPLQATTKQYSDAIRAASLPIAGGIMTGPFGVGAVTVPTTHASPGAYIDALTTTVAGTVLNAYKSTASQFNYFTANAAGAGAVAMEPTGKGLAFYTAPAGAKDAAITWQAPALLDFKCNFSNTAQLPAIPSDNVNRIIATTDLTLPVGGHTVWNIYLGAGPGWKFLNAGFGGWAYVDPSGVFNLSVLPSGAAGAAIGAPAGTLTFDQTGVLTVPTLAATTLVQSNGGRIISKKAGGSPSFTCYDTTAGTAIGICNPGDGTMQLGNFFAAGNIANLWGTLSLAGLFLVPNAFGLTYNASYRYTSYGVGWAWRWDVTTGDLIWLNANAGAWNVTFTSGGLCYNVEALWRSNSDARIKRDIADYTAGIEVIRALRPRSFRLNSEVALEGTELDGRLYETAPTRIGLIAQECENIMPETVSQRAVTVDGTDYTDLRALNAGPITYALVNAVRQLDARLAQLEGAPA